MKPSKSDLLRIDSLIRSGSHAEARARVETIATKKVPREHLVELASLCRRLGLLELSLRLLRPYVRPSEKKRLQATDGEVAEYAGALVRLGAVGEAHRLLDTVNVDNYPRSFLLRAFAFISHWDFEASQVPLEKYIAHPKADPYESSIAKVNLLMGFVFQENRRRSDELIRDLLKETKKSGSSLLLANTLDMAAESAMTHGSWQEANEMIQRASELVVDSHTIDAFLIRKQAAILEVKKSQRSQRALENLKAVQQEAVQRKHWESVRDCDFHRALVSDSKSADKFFQHLYFGTPYESYRTKVAQKAGWKVLPDSYNAFLGGNAKTDEGKKLDVLTDCMTWPQLPHKLLIFLAQDFYRPRRAVEIFDALYGKDFYDPHSSGVRLRQVMKRTRQLLQAQCFAVSIIESKGTYKLAPQGRTPLAIQVYRSNFVEHSSRKQKLRVQSAFRKFQKNFSKRPLSAKEFARLCRMPLRSAQRLLNKASLAGECVKEGAASQSRYRLP